MVKHIILWKLREELSAEEKETVKAGIKAGLEGLQGIVPGLQSVHVQTDGVLPSSTADVMLDCTWSHPRLCRAMPSIPHTRRWPTRRYAPTPPCALASTSKSEEEEPAPASPAPYRQEKPSSQSVQPLRPAKGTGHQTSFPGTSEAAELLL